MLGESLIDQTGRDSSTPRGDIPGAWMTLLEKTIVTMPAIAQISDSGHHRQSSDMVKIPWNIYSYKRKTYQSRQVSNTLLEQTVGSYGKEKSLLFSDDILSICAVVVNVLVDIPK